jgi:hypothetical protein
MEKYSIRFIQPLWDILEDQPPIFMEKIINLPFIPFIGLEISSDDFQTLNPVTKIVWRPKFDQFFAYCPDDYSLRENLNQLKMDKLESIRELIELYQDLGWGKAEY